MAYKKKSPTPTSGVLMAPDMASSAPVGSAENPNMVSGPQQVQPGQDLSAIVPMMGTKEKEDPLSETLKGLDESKIDYLGRKVLEEFATCKAARYVQELVWIRCHQNDKGVYPSDTDFDTGSSRAFVQVTRPKVMNAHARLVEVCLPPGEDAWSIDPSPKPFIPELITQMLAAGAPPEDIHKAVKIAAEKSADAMSSKVKDALAETNWASKLQETLLHMCLYGTSIMAGPFVVPSDEDSDGSKRNIHHQLKARLASMSELFDSGMADEFRPEMEVISPFDFYPDYSARCIEDCSYGIVRRVMNKSQLLDLANKDGFRSKAIEEVLESTPNGNWSCETWESIINITNSQQMMSMPSGRFVILQRFGFLSGKEMKDAGIDVPDSQLNQQVMCQIWVSGGRVIFCQESKLFRSRLPFYVTPYSIVPHTIWGAGPAEFMMDSQDGINACERAKYDSMALSARPQVNVNVDRLAPGQDALEIRAGRIWATRDSMTNQGDPVKFFFPPSIVGDVQRVQQDAMAFCDEQTGLPRSLQGEGGQGIHNRTASGASMQFNSAITPLKGVAFNIDTKLISPMLRNFVKFFTEYSKDKSIVGDFQIIAKGVSGLMSREVASQKLMTLMGPISQNEEFSKRIDMTRYFDLLMRGSGLSDSKLILTEAEFMKREEAMQQQQQVASAAGEQLKANIQGEAQAKMKAETSPRDVVLQAMEAVPDSCIKLKLALIKEVLAMTGTMTPEVEAALAHEDEKQDIADQNMVAGLGRQSAIEDHGPSDMHKMKQTMDMKQADRDHQISMKEADRKHQIELAQLKAKGSVNE